MDSYEQKTQSELENVFGNDAAFRPGQKEALLNLLSGKRTLVVERTGWGKSLIYFLATRIFRDENKGMTIVISPLLSLMNNQIDLAHKFGIKAYYYNSSNKDQWPEIESKIVRNEIDILYIAPERLANNDFQQRVMENIMTSINLLVIDEAHCISDWGHDFRPDYKRIKSIIEYLPDNTSLLATTATANDRVVADVSEQLGNDLYIQRGSLTRHSLRIEVVKLNSKEQRLAWLKENINTLQKTHVGIIYCLTVADTKLISKWLTMHGYNAQMYHGRLDKNDRLQIEKDFYDNKMDILVATTAFGMGIDKPDIGFVVHFQKPGNVVAYYQQIGRAGRGLDSAKAILLAGDEDDKITSYFIDTAFPTQQEMDAIINLFDTKSSLNKNEISASLDIKFTKLDKALKLLLIDGYLYKECSKFFRSTKKWTLDMSYSKEITETRRRELEHMNEFINHEECYMQYIAHELNDDTAETCGVCSNCLNESLFDIHPSKENIIEALNFLKIQYNFFEPRKRWPQGIKLDGKQRIPETLRNETGLTLSDYGDAGWGHIVKQDKYHSGYFRDDLVTAAADLIKKQFKHSPISFITNVPSLRAPELVSNFAKRIAAELNIDYINVVEKVKENKPQKNFNTSFKQFDNAFESFEIKRTISGSILLVDDMVDSRWTLTVCGYKLYKAGASIVYPFVLANSKNSI